MLIDGSTDVTDLLRLSGAKVESIHSFNLDVIDTVVLGQRVRPLLATIDQKRDAWIVSSTNELSALSLNQYLLDQSLEHQYVFHHVNYPNSTAYYSYVDFFSDKQTTAVHINNYFHRCYHLPFPLELKLTLRNCAGEVIDVRQIIIPPNAQRTVTSNDFAVTDFQGYLEVEFYLAKKVMPFLHYQVDYFSKDFISSNHQSGLGLHPSNTEFNRGYIPQNEKESLVVSLFQKHYREPITVNAILKYQTGDGQIRQIERSFPELSQNRMIYQDIKQLFHEVDFNEARAPMLVVKSKESLHRPNYYYTHTEKDGYFDVSHAARDPSQALKGGSFVTTGVLTETEMGRINALHCVGMDLRLFLFPESYQIDTWLALGNDTTAVAKAFNISVYDTAGRPQGAIELAIDYENDRYLNISELIRKGLLPSVAGTAALRPSLNAVDVPLQLNGIAAYQHKISRYLTSTAASGSSPDNVPFYFRGGPPNYLLENTSVGVTEIFARGVAFENYETYFALVFATASLNNNKSIKYEIGLVNDIGEQKILYRTLPANGSDFLPLSELIAQSGHASSKGRYTVWFTAFGGHLYGKHFLYRRSDCAIAVEHCYVGKYGV
jgi:hypothetical protein